MIEPSGRRYVRDLPAKLRLLTGPKVRERHGLSAIALSKACGMSASWLKTAKDESRGTQSIDGAVEEVLAKLCRFDPTWPEWREGTSADFEQRLLFGVAMAPTAEVHEGRIPLLLTLTEIEVFTRALREHQRPSAEVTAKLNALSQEISEPPAVVVNFFRRLDEAEALDERWHDKLLRFAEDFRTLRAELKALDSDDPDHLALRNRALAALEAGALDEAKVLLSGIDAGRHGAVVNARRELVQVAEVKAALGQVALLEFSYVEAAAHFHDASALLPGSEVEKRRGYQGAEADAWFRQGDEKGDNVALLKAINLYQGWAQSTRREQAPLEWATAQCYLGQALLRLGEREGGTERLEEAAVAFRGALKEWTPEPVRYDWARAQVNFASTLVSLSERKRDVERLVEAVAAYRAASEVFNDRAPLEWATTQNNLATALGALGEWGKDTTQIREAVGALCGALEVFSRDRAPLEWAMTKNNLGNTLRRLGELEGDTGWFRNAVVVLGEALKERTRERVPLEWAQTQNNLGNALLRLGERENGIKRFQDAVAAFGEALKERTRERVPLEWAAVQVGLGSAKVMIGRRTVKLGERVEGLAWLEEAVEAFHAALEELTRERTVLDWASTQYNLATALHTLGTQEAGTRRLEEAVSAYRAALEGFKEAQVSASYLEMAGQSLREAEALLPTRW